MPRWIGTTWSGRHQSSRLAARQDGGLDRIWCCSGIAGSIDTLCPYLDIFGSLDSDINGSATPATPAVLQQSFRTLTTIGPRLDWDYDPLGSPWCIGLSGLAWLKLIQTTRSEAWVLHEHARYMRNQDIDISWYVNIYWYLKIFWYWCRSDICRQFAIRSFAFTDIGYGWLWINALSTILWVDEHPFSWLFGCSPNVAGKVEAVIFSVKLQTCGLPHEDVALWGLQGFQLLKNQNLRLIIFSIIFSWKVVIKIGMYPKFCDKPIRCPRLKLDEWFFAWGPACWSILWILERDSLHFGSDSSGRSNLKQSAKRAPGRRIQKSKHGRLVQKQLL